MKSTYLIIIIISTFFVFQCTSKKALRNEIAFLKLSQLITPIAQNGYELFNQVILPNLVDSLNRTQSDEALHSFLNNPCYDGENHDLWKDLQLPTSLRELIIMEIKNTDILNRITHSEQCKNVCLENGQHYQFDKIPYYYLSNSELAKIRLKQLQNNSKK